MVSFASEFTQYEAREEEKKSQNPSRPQANEIYLLVSMAQKRNTQKLMRSSPWFLWHTHTQKTNQPNKQQLNSAKKKKMSRPMLVSFNVLLPALPIVMNLQ